MNSKISVSSSLSDLMGWKCPMSNESEIMIWAKLGAFNSDYPPEMRANKAIILASQYLDEVSDD